MHGYHYYWSRITIIWEHLVHSIVKLILLSPTSSSCSARFCPLKYIGELAVILAEM